MNYDQYVQKIFDYVEAYLSPPSITWTRSRFEKRSYQRYAAFELINRILDHPTVDPLDTVEVYILETEYLKHFGNGKEGHEIILVINDALCDIHRFLTSKGDYSL